MEGPLAPGAANGSIRTPSPTPPAIDPQIIVDHIERVLEATLGASNTDLRAPGSLLSPAKLQDTLQRCTRFALETQPAIYVVKERAAEARIDGPDAPNGKHFPRRGRSNPANSDSRRVAALFVYSFLRFHRVACVRDLHRHFEAPDTHRSRDTP
jgi:dynein heavy chain 1